MTMELVVVFLSVAVFSTCWASNSPEISLTRTQLLELMKRVDEIEVRGKDSFVKLESLTVCCAFFSFFLEIFSISRYKHSNGDSKRFLFIFK